MATLVFSSLGTAVGGPLGGAVGALVGRQFDSAIFGSASRSGPRLRELEVSLSSYGTAIPRVHGRMRVAGAIIWATELQEHSDVLSPGGNQPALTTYSYTANLAVALSSRPIQSIGRIWADGKLLRGASGDLKVGGILRFYTGHDSQPVDPLIAAHEGEERCPAFRDLAYVVFEALELSDYGNRIPALTFEVISDENLSLKAVLNESLDDLDVPHDITTLDGLTIDESLGASLATLAPVIPVSLDAGRDIIVAHFNDTPTATIRLEEPAISGEDDAFASATGVQHHRARAEPQPPSVLRYFDLERDFQPSTQHATGRAGAGQPHVIELPATLAPSTARAFVEHAAQRRDHAQERMSWRTTALSSAVAPGTLVTLPDRRGAWRVESWEWRASGVELELTKVVPTLASPAPAPTPPFAAPLDAPASSSRIVACEMPWDGANGASDRTVVAAIVSADGPQWNGAAIYADHGDGQLWPLGRASRTRGVIGTAENALPTATPLLVDRGSQLTVTLVSPDLSLQSADIEQLGQGTNLAIVGEELIQFSRVDNLGEGRWRLTGLLRGRHGTEHAIANHGSGEDFALLDARTTLVDCDPHATLIASGRGDREPVPTPIHLSGLSTRPLSPVHPRILEIAGGGLRLAWTRRARGGWPWRDGVDLPIAEAHESYVVTYEAEGRTLRAWNVNSPSLDLPSEQHTDLHQSAPDGTFIVRQQGTHGLSLPLRMAAQH